MAKKMEYIGTGRAFGLLQSVSDRNMYSFTVNGMQVKVVFSEKADAPTVEDGLAKILIGRIC